MALIVMWVTFSVLVGLYWHSKGKGFAGGLIVSLFLSPLIGFLIGITMQPKSETVLTRKCPYCCEMIPMEAVVCSHCQKDLPKSEPVKLIKDAQNKYHCPHCTCVISADDINKNQCWYCHKTFIN